jgi:hypothetical protein
MNRNASFYVKSGGLVLLIFIILGYSFFQAHNLIFGPSINLVSPLNNETYTDQAVDIKGTAHNAAYFSIDDRPVLLDKDGAFDEQLLLAPGYTIIKLDATDQFGKRTEKTVQVMFEDTAPDVGQTVASSSVPVEVTPVLATSSDVDVSSSSQH